MSENSTKTTGYPEFLTLAKSFSTEEMKAFLRFVKSPYFNTDEKLVTLTAYIKDNFFHKKNKKFDDKVRMKIYKLLFIDEIIKGNLMPKQRNKLNKKFSLLSDSVELFFINESLKKNHSRRFIPLYNQLIKRKLSDYFHKTEKSHRKILEGIKEVDSDYYMKKYQLEWNKSDHLFKNEMNVMLKDDNLGEVAEAFDIYYITNRIKIQLTCIALMGITKKSYDFEAMESILELSKLPEYRNLPLVAVYRAAYEMEINRLRSVDKETLEEKIQGCFKASMEGFSSLVALLNEYDEKLSHGVKLDCYTLATNFCTHQVKFNNLNYSEEVFKLFERIESKGYLLTDDGKIRLGKLNNVIIAACHNKRFDWAKTVLLKYKDCLEETSQSENIYNFNLGQIAFYEKRYEDADSSFSKVELKPADFTYFITCKVLLLKCLYELDNPIRNVEKVKHISVESVFKAAKEFIRSNKLLSDIDKESYTNFILILINLYRSRHDVNRTKAKVNRIKEILEQQTVNADKKWLIEKIAELEKTK